MTAARVLAGTERWSVLEGDCRAVLRGLPAESVQCVVTSPPYWGLRDYQVPPLVWGGVEGCEHAWGEPVRVHKGGSHGTGEAQIGRDVSARDAVKDFDAGQTCSRCGAWWGQLGLEPSVAAYVGHIVEVFREVRRVLRDDGTLWLNMGDTYCGEGASGAAMGDLLYEGSRNIKSDHKARKSQREWGGLKPKDLVGLPWRVAFALQEDGWWLRKDIVWHKPNPMPEPADDRPTSSHEYVFLLTKAAHYYYDAHAVRERASTKTHSRGNGVHPKAPPPEGREVRQNADYSAAVHNVVAQRNMRDVWTIPTQPYPEAHFATFPTELATRCVKAGTSERGACAACGAPAQRLTENLEVSTGTDTAAERVKEDGRIGGRTRRPPEPNQPGARPSKVTRGWAPSCACPDGPQRPCVVLDPFAGSGAAGLAALELGRHFLGIELSTEYTAMARRRLGAWRGQARLPGLQAWGEP